MTWTTYGPDEADGTGIDDTTDCVPSCGEWAPLQEPGCGPCLEPTASRLPNQSLVLVRLRHRLPERRPTRSGRPQQCRCRVHSLQRDASRSLLQPKADELRHNGVEENCDIDVIRDSSVGAAPLSPRQNSKAPPQLVDVIVGAHVNDVLGALVLEWVAQQGVADQAVHLRGAGRCGQVIVVPTVGVPPQLVNAVWVISVGAGNVDDMLGALGVEHIARQVA